MLSLILLVFAFVLLMIAGLVAPSVEPWRSKLACFGLACWVLAELVRTVPVVGK